MQRIEFRILGPLEVVDEGRPISAGVGRQRKLLAILLLHPNEVVSSDRLIEELWGERPPATVGKALQNHVSQLRKLLGREALATEPPGYSIRIDREQLDAARFERLVSEARANADPAEATATLDDALGLWRGEALAEFAYDSFAQAEIARLEELRLGAIEARIDARLALRHHADLVAELEKLIARYPLRERLRADLMLGLYRCGRQAEALEAYGEARRTLVDELGLEPGEELKELQRAILAHDPALDLPAEKESPPGSEPVSGRGNRRLVIGIVVAVVAGAAAAAIELATRGGGPLTVVPNSVALVDPRTNRVRADIPVGQRPVAVTTGDGSVWVANADDQTLSRIDETTRKEVTRIGIGTDESDLAFGHGSIWVAGGNDGTLTRVDASSNVIEARLSLGRGNGLVPKPVFAVATGAGAVWATRGDSVVRIDPTSNAVTKVIRVRRPSGIAADNGAIWVTSTAARIFRFDARTGTRTATIVVPGRAIAPAVGGASLWAIIATGAEEIWRLNAVTAESLGTSAGGQSPVDLAWGLGSMWAANASIAGTVWRLDRAGRTVATIRVGDELTGVAADESGVWVTVEAAT